MELDIEKLMLTKEEVEQCWGGLSIRRPEVIARIAGDYQPSKVLWGIQEWLEDYWHPEEPCPGCDLELELEEAGIPRPQECKVK